MQLQQKPLPPKKLRHYLLRGALYFGILLLLLIPTYIAVANYVLTKNAPVEDSTTVYDSFAMTGPTGVTKHASADINKSLFAIFTELLANGSEVTEVPSTHLTGHYTLEMSNASLSDPYHFYFSVTSPVCYYTTPAGKHFVVDHDLADTFLNSSYAHEMYTAATLPVLTTAATDEVIPSSLSWYYRTQQGAFTQLSSATTTSQQLTYPIANDIAFYFSIEPSFHEVIIRRDGTELYRGSATDIALTLEDRDEVLDFEINAIYNQDSRTNYYGTIVYRFRMQVVEAAQFSLNATQTVAGSCLLLRCEYVKNTEKLEITAEPALPCAPVVFESGELVYALIPLTEAGSYSLRVAYGTIAAPFTLDVTPAPSTAHTPDTGKLGDWVALLEGLPALITEKGAASASALLPNGGFLAPEYEKLFAFGDTVTVAGTPLDETPLPFHLYRTDGAVHTLSAGKVLEVGNDHPLLGTYVIVDHGCGLYTWYVGLSEVQKFVGDPVARGERIGYGGTTLYHDPSVLILTTVGKAAISTDFICNTPSTILQ